MGKEEISSKILTQKYTMNQWVDMKPQQQSDNICTFIKTSGIEKVRVSMIHF